MAVGRVNVSGGGVYTTVKKFNDGYLTVIDATSGFFLIDKEENTYRINGSGTNFRMFKADKNGNELWKVVIGYSSFPPVYGIKKVMEYGDYLFYIVATGQASENYVERIDKITGERSIVYNSRYACSFDIVNDKLIYIKYMSPSSYDQTLTISMYDLNIGVNQPALIFTKNIDGFNSLNRDKFSDVTVNTEGNIVCIGQRLDSIVGYITFYNVETDTITRIVGAANANRSFVIFHDNLFYISNDSRRTTYVFDENMQEILNFNLSGISQSVGGKRLFAKDGFLVYEIKNNGEIKKAIVPYFISDGFFRPLIVDGTRAYIEGGIYLKGI